MDMLVYTLLTLPALCLVMWLARRVPPIKTEDDTPRVWAASPRRMPRPWLAGLREDAGYASE